jgi:type IV secretory pathway VirB2 component (pilin)
MQITLRRLVPKLINTIALIFILCENAHATLSMPVREHFQTIIWIVDAVTVVIALGIALLVGRVSKKT